MQSRRVPRLGLFARIGFGGLVGAVVLSTVVLLDIRFTAADPSQSAAVPQLALPKPPARPSLALVDAAKAGAAKDDAAKDEAAGGGRSIADILGPTAVDDTVTGALPAAGAAPSAAIGSVSGLPIPRFVSLKTDKVNVRQGPTRDQKVSFIFQQAGLPVEVIAEWENWRRIRDSEGSEGWVLQSLLSGRRTALIAPWSKEATLRLHSRADDGSAPVALLQPGVLASIKLCEADWCRISGQGFDGWIEQQKLWGAYPGESID